MGAKSSTITTVVHLKNKGIKDLAEVKNLQLLTLFTRLNTIYLQQNKIATISPTVCALITSAPRLQEFLQEVNLSNNKLVTLPEEFFLLINLRRLYLDYNKLSEFPRGILSFYRLEELSIRHNNITHLPWHLGRMRELTVFRLDHNHISYIPNTIVKLQKLSDFQVLPNPVTNSSEESMVFYSGDLDAVLSYLCLQTIPEDYPYRDEYDRAQQEKRERLERMTEDQRMVKKILKHREGFVLFEKYMKKEHSQENILFWKKIYDFQKKFGSDREITTEELIGEAMAIFQEFIALDSKYTINIPGGVNELLTKIFTDTFVYPKGINQWVFQDANRAIIDLFSRDTFKRFKTSTEGAELIKKLQEEQVQQKKRSIYNHRHSSTALPPASEITVMSITEKTEKTEKSERSEKSEKSEGGGRHPFRSSTGSGGGKK